MPLKLEAHKICNLHSIELVSRLMILTTKFNIYPWTLISYHALAHINNFNKEKNVMDRK